MVVYKETVISIHRSIHLFTPIVRVMHTKTSGDYENPETWEKKCISFSHSQTNEKQYNILTS